MTVKLTLILAESALELVPQSIASHTACRNHAKKHNKRPTHTILDGSIHHSAMRKLPDKERRGRPDIVHFCLLEALGSPLNREGRMDTWVHTVDDRVMHFDPALKLPRSQERFKGVMEKLMVEGMLDNQLITQENGVSFSDLVERIAPASAVGLVEGGEPFGRLTRELAGSATESDVASGIEGDGEGEGGPTVALVVGGFAHGTFSSHVMQSLTHKVSVYRGQLDAWTALSRALGEIERTIDLVDNSV